MSVIGFVLCVCTGDCPGFASLNIWDLVNQVRLALPVEWAIIHPQLCEEDGDRFLENLVMLAIEKDQKYFIAGCSPNMQRKLLGPAFTQQHLAFEDYIRPLDVRNMSTDDAFIAIEDQLNSWGVLSE